DLRERYASLSPREREIVIHVARGRLSKQIAHDIGIAEATVKVHRSRAMQKMKAVHFPNSAEWPTSSSWCLISHSAPEIERPAQLLFAGISDRRLSSYRRPRRRGSHQAPQPINLGSGNTP